MLFANQDNLYSNASSIYSGVNSNKRTRFNVSSLCPILDAKTLLESDKHHKVLHEIQMLIDIDANAYEILYQKLIDNFVEFVQLLPYGEHGEIGSLMNRALSRSLTAVRMLSEMGTLKNNQLLSYAIFSSALLKDCAQVLVNRKVMITDAKGLFIQEWHPYQRAMSSSTGSHFKIYYTNQTPRRFSSWLSPMFARHIIPEEGYCWLAENPAIWVMWHAVIGDSAEDDTGIIGIYLDKALIRLEKEPIHLENKVELIEGFNLDGETFWNWLKKMLATGSLKDVKWVESGLQILNLSLIDQFVEALSDRDYEAAKVWKEFKELGLLLDSDSDDIIIRKEFFPSSLLTPNNPIEFCSFSQAVTYLSYLSELRENFILKNNHS